jgi:hypothetical protein
VADNRHGRAASPPYFEIFFQNQSSSRNAFAARRLFVRAVKRHAIEQSSKEAKQ